MLRKLLRALGMPARVSHHRDFLLEMLPKHGVGAEIGVHKGDFSAQLLAAAQPKTLHLIDPWKYESGERYRRAWYGGASSGQGELDARCEGVRKRFARQIASGQVQINRGFSSDILSSFADGYLDWIYIDGNHYYDFVKQDLELSFTKTRAGGLITGDDYEEGGAWQSGVKNAVDEFVRAHPVQLLELRNRQFILRR